MVNILPPSKFVAESTLGKLCKWMRMAGLDTLFDRRIPEPERLAHIGQRRNRLVLTRTREIYRALGPDRALFINANQPQDQMHQLVQTLGLRKHHLKPMTRCLHCNHLVEACNPADVRDQVPEYIFQTHNSFHRCPQCGRIFWPGSHTRRTLEMVDAWFSK